MRTPSSRQRRLPENCSNCRVSVPMARRRLGQPSCTSLRYVRPPDISNTSALGASARRPMTWFMSMHATEAPVRTAEAAASRGGCRVQAASARSGTREAAFMTRSAVCAGSTMVRAGGCEGGGEGGAERLGTVVGAVGGGPLGAGVGAGGALLQPGPVVCHAPGEHVAQLPVGEHEVEIGPGVIGDGAVALRDVAGDAAVVDVELGDEELVAHARHLIEEAAPGALVMGAEDRRIALVVAAADVRLDAQRIDRGAALAEPFEEAEHAGPVLLVARLPRHVIVVDELAVGDCVAGGAEAEVEDVVGAAAHGAGEDRLAHLAGLRVDRLVDHVTAGDARSVAAAEGGDGGGEQPLRLGRRAGAEIVVGDPGRPPFGVMPDEVVAAHGEAVGGRPGEQAVAAGEIEDAGGGLYPAPFELVLRNDQAAFAGDDVAVARIGEGAFDMTGAAHAHGRAEAAAGALCDGVEGGPGSRGGRSMERRRRGCGERSGSEQEAVAARHVHRRFPSSGSANSVL